MANEIDVFIEATEQLKALKETIKKQQDTGLKLQGVYESFIRIADEVGKLPKGLNIVLDKAETTAKQMKVSSAKVDALSNSIPEIVARIERSDFWQSAAALTTELKSNRDELEKFREVAKQFNGVLNAHFESQAQWRHDVMSALQEQVGGISEIKNFFSSKLENMTENQDRLSQNLIAVQNQQAKNINGITQAIATIQEKQISSSTDLNNLASGMAEIKNLFSSRLENITENQDRLSQNMIAAQNQQTKNMSGIAQAITTIQEKQISSSTDLSNIITSSRKDYGTVLEKVSTAFGQIAESTSQTNLALKQVRDQEIEILVKIDGSMTEQNKVLKNIEAKKVSIF